MGWRKTQADVQSGRKSFAPKNNDFGQGFAKFSDIVAKKWMMDAASKTKADALTEKETRAAEKAERDRILEETREKDKKDKENVLTATAALELANLDPENGALFNKAYSLAQGGSNTDNIFAYFDSGIKGGDIEVTSMQGPMPGASTNPVLSKYESGSGGANALLNQSQTGQFSGITVSTMPIGEVMAFQSKRGGDSYHAWSKANMPKNTEASRRGLGSTPVGTYQFVGETLQELKRNGTFEALGITDDTVFDEETQEKLFIRYAQDSLKGLSDPTERRDELRAKWEGLKNASDAEVDSVIESIETGTFSSSDMTQEISRDTPGFGMEDSAIFSSPTEEFDEIDISGIKTFEDWSAENVNIKANKKNVDPEFMTFFNERGDNLKDLDAKGKIEDIFSIDVLLEESMTASKLTDRIALAKAKGLVVPKYIEDEVMPILDSRQQYTEAQIIDMTPEKRALVAKFSTNVQTREIALKINSNDPSSFSWISDISGDEEKAKAIAQQFLMANDIDNFNLASNIATKIRNNQKPYLALLELENLVGKTAQQLTSIKRITTNSGATTEELAILQSEIEAATRLEATGDYRKYGEAATNADKTETQIALAIMEGAPNETISMLTQVLNKQTKASKKLEAVKAMGLGVQAIDSVVTDENGIKRYEVVYITAEDNTPRNSAGIAVKAVPQSKAEGDAFNTIRTETQANITKLGIANNAVTEGMITAASAVELVQGDERVRGKGGALAGLIRSTVAGGGELFSVAEELFKEQDTVTIEDLQNNSAFNNEILDAVLSGNVQNLANETARFQAKMLSLAFQVGRMEGQSGNAMSNQDFKKIMEIVNTKGGADAFEKNLVDYMNSKIMAYDREHNRVVGPGSQSYGFKTAYKYNAISEPLNMKDYVANINQPKLTSAYNMFTGTQPEQTFPTPNPKHVDRLKSLDSPEARAAFEEKFGPGSAAEALGETL